MADALIGEPVSTVQTFCPLSAETEVTVPPGPYHVTLHCTNNGPYDWRPETQINARPGIYIQNALQRGLMPDLDRALIEAPAT